MIMTRWAAYAVGALTAAALLTACSSSGLQSPAPSSELGTNSSALQVPNPLADRLDPALGVPFNGPIHRDQRKSWISPDIERAPQLLFASDVSTGVGAVYIFRLPDMAREGVITGFQGPAGECSDRHGNVYVVDAIAEKVLQYSRTGTLLNTYNTNTGELRSLPISCAVNPTNGDLAVTSNLRGVLIYSSPSSPPTVLRNSDQSLYFYAGYAPNGDLWVSGLTPTHKVVFSSCSASSCITINITGGTIYGIGAVQWDNVAGTWVVFDTRCNDSPGTCSYPVSGSGVLGTRTTYLNYEGTNACDIVQGVVEAPDGMRYVVGGDYESCGFAHSSLSRWAYPAGGTPTNYTTQLVVRPFGAAVSSP